MVDWFHLPKLVFRCNYCWVGTDILTDFTATFQSWDNHVLLVTFCIFKMHFHQAYALIRHIRLQKIPWRENERRCVIQQHINGLSLTKHSLNDLSCIREKVPFFLKHWYAAALLWGFPPFKIQALQITFPKTDPYQYMGIKGGDVHLFSAIIAHLKPITKAKIYQCFFHSFHPKKK